MSTFTIEYDGGNTADNYSIEDIYNLRRDQSLVIHVKGEGDFYDKYSYIQFCKLAIARKEIQSLELREIKDKFPPGGSVKCDTMKELMEFLKFAASTVKTFSGENPSQLAPFITKIKLVQSLSAGKPSYAAQYLEFIKGRCEGKAHRIAVGCNSVEEIIEELQNGIHFDSSRVLESRLTAIQFDNRNLTDFTVEVEKVADQLHEALMVEGVSNKKAMEMTIDRVVEICRKQARSSVVKSVLASAYFHHPKEVLSKFTTEVAIAARESNNTNSRYQSNPRQGTYNTHSNRSNNFQRYANSYQQRNYGSQEGPHQHRNYGQHPNQTPGNFLPRGQQSHSSIRTMHPENDQLPADRPTGEMIEQ